MSASEVPPAFAQIAFPHGHLGYLTGQQEEALKELKDALSSQELYIPVVDNKSPSHNDATLLRFLRARSFIVKDAVQQFRETERWRRINDIESLYMNIDVEDYDMTRRYASTGYFLDWISANCLFSILILLEGEVDKRGMPVTLFRVAALDSKAMAAYSKRAPVSVIDSTDKDRAPAKLLPLFAIFEYVAGWLTQLSTVLNDRSTPEVPITQSNNIVDISGVGLRQFWSLRTHMQDATVLATSHYPEMLDRIFIIGAPSFFPSVWSWVKGIFDPITASKIFILSEAQVFPTLSQFIEPENIPKRYGGNLDFEFGDIPTIDPAYADRLTWRDGASGIMDAEGRLRRWPRGPVKWVVREDGDWDLLAVGSVGGETRRDHVATLKIGNHPGGSADHSIPHSGKVVHGDVQQTS